ncbi:hypothetical protein [Streptomyces sp. NPDC046371]|uniref:hypothetical protein n=1 Tax=unclassified Streptomyces TaxID=2593676 RepID=UPI0033C24194
MRAWLLLLPSALPADVAVPVVDVGVRGGGGVVVDGDAVAGAEAGQALLDPLVGGGGKFQVAAAVRVVLVTVCRLTSRAIR